MASGALYGWCDRANRGVVYSRPDVGLLELLTRELRGTANVEVVRLFSDDHPAVAVRGHGDWTLRLGSQWRAAGGSHRW